MTMSCSYTINEKYEFVFTAGSSRQFAYIDGVTISPNTVIDEGTMQALKIALDLYPDYYDYACAVSHEKIYYPMPRECAYPHLRSEFVQELQRESTKRVISTVHESQKPTRAPRKGYVYLLQAIEPNHYYKIGRTNNPERRIKELGVKLPYPIELLHLIPTDDMDGLELDLHMQFSHKRVNGEWFALAPDDVNYITSIES